MAKDARVTVSVQIPAETRLARPDWVRAAAVEHARLGQCSGPGTLPD